MGMCQSGAILAVALLHSLRNHTDQRTCGYIARILADIDEQLSLDVCNLARALRFIDHELLRSIVCVLANIGHHAALNASVFVQNCFDANPRGDETVSSALRGMERQLRPHMELLIAKLR